MSKKAIIIWGIVIAIAIIGIVATAVLLNNGSSANNSNNKNNSSNNSNSANNTNTTNIPTEQNIERNLDYSYVRQTIPNNLQSKLPESKNSNVIDYYYSKDLGIAFAYEVISLVDKNNFINITPPENAGTPNTIYLHHFNEAKDSGQSVEIIDIEDNLRFSTIPEIINIQILDEKERELCEIEEQNNRYSIIAKDIKVKDSTPICGKYAKGNNRFFIKPRQEGSAISKLIFVNAGSQELSYDGTMQGQYWYESIILE